MSESSPKNRLNILQWLGLSSVVTGVIKAGGAIDNKRMINREVAEGAVDADNAQFAMEIAGGDLVEAGGFVVAGLIFLAFSALSKR